MSMRFNYRLAVTIFLIYAAIWSFFLVSSGAFFTQYHFMDDQLILTNYEQYSQGASVFEVFKNRMLDEYTIKLRPVNVFHMALITKLFGTHFMLWHTYYLFLVILASSAFCYFMLNVGFSFFLSILFPLFFLFGYSSIIWWTFGYHEALSTLFFALSLALSVRTAKVPSVLSGLFLAICIVIMSLCKESYILMLPALIFIQIWLITIKQNINWKASFYKNRFFTIFISLIFISELLYLKFVIASNSIYMGQVKFAWIPFFKTGVGLFIFGGGVILSILLLMLFYLLAKGWVVINFRSTIPFLILSVLAVLPQMYLYSNFSFMGSGRYLLPGVIVFAVLIFSVVHVIAVSTRGNHNRTLIGLKWGAYVLLGLCFGANLSLGWFHANRDFKTTGALNHALIAIGENTSRPHAVLMIFNPFFDCEATDAFAHYMSNKVWRCCLLFTALFARKHFLLSF